MKVQCDKCEATYNISDDKIPNDGAKIKCPKCSSTILVMKPIHDPPHSPVEQSVQNDMSNSKQAKANNKKNSKKTIVIMLVVGIGIIASVLIFQLTIGAQMRASRFREIDKLSQQALENMARRGHDSVKVMVGEANEEISPSNFARFKQIADTLENIEWGTSPERIPNIQLNQKEDQYKLSAYSYYDDKTEFLKIYEFFDNKLNQISIFTENPKEAKKWVEFLKSKFGKEDIKTDNEIHWIGNSISVGYFHKSNGLHIVSFINNALVRKQTEYAEKINS